MILHWNGLVPTIYYNTGAVDILFFIRKDISFDYRLIPTRNIVPGSNYYNNAVKTKAVRHQKKC